MTTYIVYKKSTRDIVRIDSTGGGATGPDREMGAYSGDPTFITEHAVWTVPLAFHAKLRMDVLHAIGTNAKVLLSGQDVLGIKVNDRTDLDARARTARKLETLSSAISEHKEQMAVVNFLAANPLSDDTDARAIEAEHANGVSNALVEWERVEGGGAVPLKPILDARAGQEIRTDD